MGSIFGGSKKPTPPPIEDKIESDPLTDVKVPELSTAEVQENAKNARISAARRKGRTSTILTASRGVEEDAPITQKKLGSA
tara:strand:+ start:1690 stop:1932 length:243 start_codon:yes stop_codon:yes gene_type:complete